MFFVKRMCSKECKEDGANLTGSQIKIYVMLSSLNKTANPSPTATTMFLWKYI